MVFTSCQPSTKREAWIEKALDVASYQLNLTAEEMKDSVKMPRSLWTGIQSIFWKNSWNANLLPLPIPYGLIRAKEKLGTLRSCDIYDWTSGFFPGSLWYAYELTGNERLKEEAIRYTNRLYPVRKYRDNHDIGFMMNCSYGNALRLAPNDSIISVLSETADNLCSRFNVQIGCIRSWDFGTWNYPVIIDNMMNLDLLFHVSKLTGDMRYRQVAIQHARTQ